MDVGQERRVAFVVTVGPVAADEDLADPVLVRALASADGTS